MKNIFKIAMVDDDEIFLHQLKEYGERAKQDLQLNVSIDTFSDSEAFANEHADQYDIIFLDIEMP